MASLILDSIPIAVAAATPLLLAVEGELVAQRSGIINLGIEGVMLFAALAAAAATHMTGSIGLGFAAAIAAALLANALFGLFAIVFAADQVVTGTALNLLALGTTGVLYGEMLRSGSASAILPRPSTDLVAPFAWIAVPIVLFVLLWRTSFGLRLRACGEHPAAVRATGRSVALHRGAALGIEAILAGLAGAHLALVLSSGFAENMTAGRGFIALAIVIFGRWNVPGALAGTALFGFAAAAQYALQAANQGLPYHLLLAVPYVVTLLILVFAAGRVRSPEALGQRQE
jgi:general nucleoside transport system permease protein